MTVLFHPLPAADVADIRATHVDSYGTPVEQAICTGPGHPCRACLRETAAGQPFLTLAHRPFRRQHAFAETGPIYLCATCDGTTPSATPPAILSAPTHIVRGYSADERIVYGTGRVTPTEAISAYATELLARDDIAFVDVRSASNNCFLCRIHPA